jgi:hypothetical protein
MEMRSDYMILIRDVPIRPVRGICLLTRGLYALIARLSSCCCCRVASDLAESYFRRVRETLKSAFPPIPLGLGTPPPPASSEPRLLRSVNRAPTPGKSPRSIPARGYVARKAGEAVDLHPVGGGPRRQLMNDRWWDCFPLPSCRRE